MKNFDLKDVFEKIVDKDWKLVSVVFILVGFLIIYIFVGFILNDIKINNNGIETRAVVVYKDENYKRGSLFKNYFVEYEFVTQDNRGVKGKDKINKDLYLSVNKGDKIDVLYLADNPKKHNKVKNTNNFSIFPLYGLILLAFGIYALKFGYKKTKVRQKLLQNGMKTKAVLIKDAQINAYTYNVEKLFTRVYYRDVYYEFTDNKGQKYKGRGKYLLKETKHEYMKGEEIEVIYNPENPEDNFWINEIK